MGETRRAGSSTYKHPKEKHEVIFACSPFKKIENYEFEYEYCWTVDSIVGFYLSTSYCSEFVLGDKEEPFVEDLRQSLYKINRLGKFKETRLLQAILAWKN